MLGRVSTHPSRVIRAALLGLAVILAACSSVPNKARGPDSSLGGRAPDQGQRVVELALQYRGAPYVWGGEAPAGFDCSGFVRYVYAQLGVTLPHNAAMQYRYGSAVSRDNLEPGDLVFFDRLRHNGIYIGEGRFIHARQTGKYVGIAGLDDGWYRTHWYGAPALRHPGRQVRTRTGGPAMNSAAIILGVALIYGVIALTVAVWIERGGLRRRRRSARARAHARAAARSERTARHGFLRRSIFRVVGRRTS